MKLLRNFSILQILMNINELKAPINSPKYSLTTASKVIEIT